MKAVQIVKPLELKVIDVEKPVIDSLNNVLIKMTAAGICGSDVGIYLSALIQADIILGKHLCKPGENRYILQKRETNSAREQPVRNNPIGRNGRGSDAPSFPLEIGRAHV